MIRIGHRGAAGWEPQNTRLSFEKAITLGCDFIETDVHLCKTGELILCHDARIDATSNGTGLIAEMSLDELQRYDFGKGQTVMHLEQLLDLAIDRIGLNIELKGPGSGTATAGVLKKELVDPSGWWHNHLMVTSFNHRELRAFQNALPSVPAGALIKAVLLDTAAYLDQLDVSFLVTSVEFIDKDLVGEVHATGRDVYVYTVDDPADIARMQHLGADGLIGNFPDRFPLPEPHLRRSPYQRVH